MLLRSKGVDIATIALWLGHSSTQTTHIYEHADPALKEQAIARTAPLGAKPGPKRWAQSPNLNIAAIAAAFSSIGSLRRPTQEPKRDARAATSAGSFAPSATQRAVPLRQRAAR